MSIWEHDRAERSECGGGGEYRREGGEGKSEEN